MAHGWGRTWALISQPGFSQLFCSGPMFVTTFCFWHCDIRSLMLQKDLMLCQLLLKLFLSYNLDVLASLWHTKVCLGTINLVSRDIAAIVSNICLHVFRKHRTFVWESASFLFFGWVGECALSKNNYQRVVVVLVREEKGDVCKNRDCPFHYPWKSYKNECSACCKGTL